MIFSIDDWKVIKSVIANSNLVDKKNLVTKLELLIKGLELDESYKKEKAAINKDLNDILVEEKDKKEEK